jgi:hypothetical protein
MLVRNSTKPIKKDNSSEIFIFYLLNDAANGSNDISSGDRVVMNNNLERMRKN